MIRSGISLALLSAVLFGASTPFAKLLLEPPILGYWPDCYISGPDWASRPSISPVLRFACQL